MPQFWMNEWIPGYRQFLEIYAVRSNDSQKWERTRLSGSEM